MKKLSQKEFFFKLKSKSSLIYDISRDKSNNTNDLLIYVKLPEYILKKGKKELIIKNNHVFTIACVDPADLTEPYTDKTLNKALKEFPILMNNEILEVKKLPGFVSFKTFNTPLTPEELTEDINHVFNYTTFNNDTDPIKKAVGIKASKQQSPAFPKLPKKKRDKLFLD